MPPLSKSQFPDERMVQVIFFTPFSTISGSGATWMPLPHPAGTITVTSQACSGSTGFLQLAAGLWARVVAGISSRSAHEARSVFAILILVSLQGRLLVVVFSPVDIGHEPSPRHILRRSKASGTVICTLQS